MKRATQLFSESDKARLATSIGSAEKKTSAEIVSVVATASGRYDRAEDIFGFLTSLAFVAIGWLTCPAMRPVSTWDSGLVLSPAGLLSILLTMVIGFTIGCGMASRIPILRLPFVPKKEMDEEVRRAAEAAFMRSRVRKTAGRSGILLYVSIFEHRVVVLPDDTIADSLPAQAWQDLCDTLVAGMKNGRPVEALEKAIAQCGDILAAKFPRQANDIDELGNELVLID